VVVAIETKELTEEQEGHRAPVDLICVIDISGSMEGEKLALVRKTLLSLLTMMGDQDRLCLIQFDNNAEVLVPLKRVGSHNVELMKRMVNSLEARGGTNIANGVDLAF
jgi:Mg-chelatase subunit ChlD